MPTAHSFLLAVALAFGLAGCGDAALPKQDDAAGALDVTQDDASLSELGDDATVTVDDANANPADALVAETAADAEADATPVADAGAGTDANAGADDAAFSPDAAAEVSAPTGCGIAAAVGTKTATVTFAKKDRTYLVHVPKGYDPNKPAPVVLAFLVFQEYRSRNPGLPPTAAGVFSNSSKL